jgi:transposase
VAHPSAHLSVFSRQLLVKRVIVDGWPVAMVAEQLGISRATGNKWVRRYRADGLPGIEERSSRPHRSPRRSSAEETARIGDRLAPHVPGAAAIDVRTLHAMARQVLLDGGRPVRLAHDGLPLLRAGWSAR